MTPLSPLSLEPDVIDDRNVATPAWPEQIGVRRPALFPMRTLEATDINGSRFCILGEGGDALEAQRALQAKGAVLCSLADADIIVDMDNDVMTSFHAAQSRAETQPSRWVTVTRLGGLDRSTSAVDDASRRARAGSPNHCSRVAVRHGVDVHPALGAQRSASTRDVSRRLERLREPSTHMVGATIGYQGVAPPTAAPYGAKPPVVLITGGIGISARIAQSARMERSSWPSLAAPARPARRWRKPPRKRYERSKAEGKRGTPAEIDALLAQTKGRRGLHPPRPDANWRQRSFLYLRSGGPGASRPSSRR